MGRKNNASDNVGKVLHRLRKDNDWTLSVVSAKTGVAISTLSKIENNQSSPNYDVLVRLAEGLGMELVEFFKSASFTTFAPGSRTINRVHDSIVYNSALGEYHVLSNELARKTLQPMLVCVPRGKEAPDILSNHGGEEFIYVLSGTLKFFMEPYSATVLEQGESVHFDGVMPHGFVAVGDEDAWILSVCLSEREIVETKDLPDSATSLSEVRK